MSSTASLNQIITEAVRYLMEVRGPKKMSQGLLARKTGVSQTTISMNLRGERGWTAEVLEKISDGLGSTPEEVIAIGRVLHSEGKCPKKLLLRMLIDQLLELDN